jgi:hypothetical protein
VPEETGASRACCKFPIPLQFGTNTNRDRVISYHMATFPEMDGILQALTFLLKVVALPLEILTFRIFASFARCCCSTYSGVS